MEFQRTPRRGKLPIRYPNTIRHHRIRVGLSQRGLAITVGRTLSMVSVWERGRRLPSLPNGLRLAKALDTVVESLYPTLHEPAAVREPERTS